MKDQFLNLAKKFLSKEPISRPWPKAKDLIDKHYQNHSDKNDKAKEENSRLKKQRV